MVLEVPEQRKTLIDFKLPKYWVDHFESTLLLLKTKLFTLEDFDGRGLSKGSRQSYAILKLLPAIVPTILNVENLTTMSYEAKRSHKSTVVGESPIELGIFESC